jgi:hypothetical protein
MNEVININRGKKEEEEVILEGESFKHESLLSEAEVESLYQEAKATMKTFSPNLEDFYDDFPVEKVLADINKADLLEAQWEWEDRNSLDKGTSKRFPKLAEYMLFKYLRTWSHDKILTVMPSRYDDYVRGIDMMLEFPEAQNKDSKYSALSIDVVLGANEGQIAKLMDIKKFIIDAGVKKNGPKYFKVDGKNKFSGFMAPGVVSLSRGSIEKILVQEQEGKTEDIEKSMTPHIVAVQLLEQYKGFEAYVRSVGQEDIANAYKQAHENLEDAASHLMGDLAFNKKMDEIVESVPAIKNIRIFFKELASGQYLEDAQKIIEDEKKYAEAA